MKRSLEADLSVAPLVAPVRLGPQFVMVEQRPHVVLLLLY